MSEGDDNISMRELDPDEPQADDPAADAEVAEVDEEGEGVGGQEDAPNARQSPTLQPEGGGKEAEEEEEEGRASPAQPRVITVTPTPGKASPDFDSGVKIDNDDDEDEDHFPQKPDKAPSMASSEASLRSMSPEPAAAPKKGGSSQPPRFTNEVQPEGYRRPAAPGFNRAVGSLQCKAMIVIMAASLIAMIFIVGYIILQSDDEIATKSVSLDGNFTITNRPYWPAYGDSNSTEYQQLSQEFIDEMNATFYKSATYRDMYSNTTVEWIWNVTMLTFDWTVVTFVLNLEIPTDEWTVGVNSTTSSDDDVAVAAGVEPPVLTDIIAYLDNVTQNDAFGGLTGYISLDSGF